MASVWGRVCGSRDGYTRIVWIIIKMEIAAGRGLGVCASYHGVCQPLGGYAPECRVEGSTVMPSDAPGFGLEQKPELLAPISQLLA